ncbi:MAG TPA: DUF5961 family protein [Caulobacteraceae bacterium]|jgi:hypothetical protein
MPATEPRFYVHPTGDGRHAGHVVTGVDDPLAAALTFAEAWHGDGEEVAVMVTDCGTGKQVCYRIDLETGQAGPC